MIKKEMSTKDQPRDCVGTMNFTDVYLDNNFNTCPCGYIYGPDEIEKLREHFNKGHYGG